MAYDLFLVVVDGSGAVIQGSSDVVKLTNPFRGNVGVVKPFAVASYSFGADAPVAPAGGGSGVGKVDVGVLTVVMPDDAAAGVLFRSVCTGRHLRSVDVLVRSAGERPGLVAGVGVTSAVLSGISWGVSTTGLQRTLVIDGAVFSVGSATQRADGSFTPFAIGSYDTRGGA